MAEALEDVFRSVCDDMGVELNPRQLDQRLSNEGQGRGRRPHGKGRRK